VRLSQQSEILLSTVAYDNNLFLSVLLKYNCNLTTLLTDSNEVQIVKMGAFPILRTHLQSSSVECQRQAARTIANLTVNGNN